VKDLTEVLVDELEEVDDLVESLRGFARV